MISATRGASGLPGSGWTGRAKTSAGRVPSAAICGTGPCGVISTNFGSTAGTSVGTTRLIGPGTTTSWRSPVLPSMMVIVVVPGALPSDLAHSNWLGWTAP